MSPRRTGGKAAKKGRSARSAPGARPTTSTPPRHPDALRFSAVNGVLAAAGLASLVAGYVLLAGGSLTLAPLLLVLGYVVLLPLAIIL